MSMSNTPILSRHWSNTPPEAEGPILLIDRILPPEVHQCRSDVALDNDSNASPPPSPTASSSRNGDVLLSRKWTLREELAKRKYSRWQESRFAGTAESGCTDGDRGNNGGVEGGTLAESCTTELPRLAEQLHGRRKIRGRRPRKSLGGTNSDDSEIDILYENQRGAFLFGIPLFSQKSLLNFDPAPWLNDAFRDSLVDIMTAQVPDPSWEWAWKSWYVDMSGDVDEEGWQYSFSFSPAFSWHGAHVWFDSFVRRRRWLRKRIKRWSSYEMSSGTAGSRMTEGHMLNPHYFTIHTKRDHSRGSDDRSFGVDGGHRWSHTGETDRKDENDLLDFDDIRDIGSLMGALKNARIDREKLEAVERFLDQGEDELYYLSSRMPEIMASFIFQASRRQLLAHLSRKFIATSSQQERHAKKKDADDAAKRKVDNLLEAIRAADRQVKELEYWSDLKAMVRGGGSTEAVYKGQGRGPGWEGLDRSGPATTVDFEKIVPSSDTSESDIGRISRDQAKQDKGKAKL